jgi:hypothetical protein
VTGNLLTGTDEIFRISTVVAGTKNDSTKVIFCILNLLKPLLLNMQGEGP